MVVAWTTEMEELFYLFDPWMEWRVKNEAPHDVKEAERQFIELYAYENSKQKHLKKSAWTDEMKRLHKITHPWVEWRMKEEAPQEARNAKDKYYELYAYEKNRQMRLEGYVN